MRAFSKILVLIVMAIMIFNDNMTVVYTNGEPPHLVMTVILSFLYPSNILM